MMVLAEFKNVFLSYFGHNMLSEKYRQLLENCGDLHTTNADATKLRFIMLTSHFFSFTCKLHFQFVPTNSPSLSRAVLIENNGQQL